MPKLKQPKSSLIHTRTENHSSLSKNGNMVFCQACSKQIPCEKKYQIDQHLATKIHEENNKRMSNNSKRQTFLNDQPNQNNDLQLRNTFKLDLCKALVCANIPIFKLENNAFCSFLEKYTSQSIPSQSTLRKTYVDKIYDAVIDQIRADLRNEDFWISVDETTNDRGEYVANLIVGKLCNDGSDFKPYLLRSKVLEKANFATISRFVNEGIEFLFNPEPVKHEKIFLMVTDGAAYMLKAGQSLKIFYLNLVHLTCMSHAFNLLAECVRLSYPLLNSLISNGKKIFLKAPLRIAAFKDMCPGISLPPAPVVTRWGTWLNAVQYYATNYKFFKNVVNSFVDDNSAEIAECKQLFRKPEIEAQLQFVKAHFVFLSENITFLEKQGLSLIASMNCVEEVKNNLMEVPGECGEKVKKKLNSVLSKNPGYSTMKIICSVLNGNEDESELLPDNIKAHIATFKFAPIQSTDVERSFSAYKQILTDKRHNLTNDNLEKYIVCYCNNNINNN